MIIISYSSYGQSSYSSVSSYKRRYQNKRNSKGQIRPKYKVQSYTKKSRNWGKATELHRKIAEFSKNPDPYSIKIKNGEITNPEILGKVRIPKEVTNVFRKYPSEDVPGLFLKWRQDVLTTVVSGIREGINEFIRREINLYVPQRTGKLRASLIRSLRMNLGGFPILMEMGTPGVKYASIVNNYTAAYVQLIHSGGVVESGRGNSYLYNSMKGDPHAIYHFFHALVAKYRSFYLHKYIRFALERAKIPKEIYDWCIKIKTFR